MARRHVSGLELSRRFYGDMVAPILKRRWPSLAYSAALIGPGSEVLGYDDEMSRDHHWGPRALLFLDAADAGTLRQAVVERLANELPCSCLGYPTNFSEPDPCDHGVQRLEEVAAGPVRHRVEVTDLASFLQGTLGIRDWRALEPADWLTLPEQKLRSLTAGEVFHDGLGVLGEMRLALAYYPHDVWLFQMAAAWARIGQEEHLMGRAGFAGDEVGSALIGARLVRDIMRLGFMMERIYTPYAKWLGTAFRALACGPPLTSTLQAVLCARDWKSRQSFLVPAYERLAAMHNALGVTDRLPEKTKQFFGRPFAVMAIQGFADALLARVREPFLTERLRRSPIGGIDQVSDNTDLLEDPGFRPILRKLYDQGA